MKKLLVFLAILVIASMAVQTFLVHNFVYQTQNSLNVDGKTTQASVGLCIAPPSPYLNTTCPEVFNQSTRLENNSVTCLFKGEDGIGSSLNRTIIFPEAEGLFINYTQSTFTLELDANNTGVGTYTIDYDFRNLEPSCQAVEIGTFEFQVLFINDPPEFSGQIPSRQIQEGTTLSLFFLDEHFSDPDNTLQELNFSVRNSNNFDVDINQTTLEVRITNPSGNCDSDIIYYEAKDPGNLTAQSNPVTLESVCDEPPQASGGGGGAPRTCEPDWNCNRWQPCRPDNTQIRECYDVNACDPDNFRLTQERECEYEELIEEEESETQPEEEEEETTREPSEVQTPTPSTPDEDFTVIYMILGILSVVIIFLVLFRNRLRKTYYALLWYLTRKHRKQKLLSKTAKQDLLQTIEKLENDVATSSKKTYKTTSKNLKDITKAYRTYFSKIGNVKFEFTTKQIRQELQKIINKPLQDALHLAEQKNKLLETKKVTLTKSHVMLLIEELRLFTLATSNTKPNDYNYFVRNMPIEGSLQEQVLKLLFNATQALQFEKVNDAKAKYLDAIELIDELPDEKQEKIRQDSNKIHNLITYILAYTK